MTHATGIIYIFFIVKVIRPPVYGCNGRSYKMLVMFIRPPGTAVPDGLMFYP